MGTPIRFAINRIAAATLSFDTFLDMCARLGVDAVEIRNDLKGIEIADSTPPEILKAAAQRVGISIASINALYPFDQFNQFDATQLQQAKQLISYASQCGAKALVMCPTNSRDDQRSPKARRADLVASLKSLKTILDDHGIIGLVEPLGFEECVLRRKAAAVEAIYEAGGEETYRLVHDTFHHHLAGELDYFPDLTGLVHISGVEDAALPVGDMRDGHRVLVGEGDRLNNLAQLRTLRERGYNGLVSYEPFAAHISHSADIEVQLKRSMDFVSAALN